MIMLGEANTVVAGAWKICHKHLSCVECVAPTNWEDRRKCSLGKIWKTIYLLTS